MSHARAPPGAREQSDARRRHSRPGERGGLTGSVLDVLILRRAARADRGRRRLLTERLLQTRQKRMSGGGWRGAARREARGVRTTSGSIMELIAMLFCITVSSVSMTCMNCGRGMRVSCGASHGVAGLLAQRRWWEQGPSAVLARAWESPHALAHEGAVHVHGAAEGGGAQKRRRDRSKKWEEARAPSRRCQGSPAPARPAAAARPRTRRRPPRAASAPGEP